MNTASVFCTVESSISSCDARGVALLATAENAATMVLAEKMDTVSMLDARMFSRLSSASEPSWSATPSGIQGPSQVASMTAAKAARAKSAQRSQVLRTSRCRRKSSFSDMPSNIRKPWPAGNAGRSRAL